MKTEKTKVVFRTYKDGEVIALFPDIDEGNYYCMSYMHIGQHGAADYSGVIRDTKPASPEQYKDLQRELENIGYSLLIRKRK